MSDESLIVRDLRWSQQLESWKQGQNELKILNREGRIIPSQLPRPYGKRMYAVAKMDRLTADWPSSLSSANSEIQTSAVAVRNRTRQLERDDDYMRRMLRLFQNNVIGHNGIMLEMKIREQIGTDGKGRPKFQYDVVANQMVKDAWNKYQRPKFCTVSRNLSGIQVQRLAVRAFKRDGAILIRKFPGFANEFGFAIQPLEIDHLDHNYMGIAPVTGNRILFGVEFDKYQAAVAYHLLTEHPGDVFAQGRKRTYRERVPADEIYLIQDIERAGQILGMSDMCSVPKRIHALNKYEEAEAVAARVAACKGGFITKKYPEGYNGPVDLEGNAIEEMSPGMIQELAEGEEFIANDPKHPMDAYPSYVKSQIRGAAAGANLSYNTVANDLESVNYSSLKAGRLEDIEEFETVQGLFIEQLMQPWFEDWLPFAILSGQVKLPFAKLEKFKAAAWRPRTWKSVEPLKEAQADKLEVDEGFASRSEKVSDRGRAIEDVDEENEEAEKSEESHGLKYGAAPTAPGEEEDPDKKKKKPGEE